MATARLKTAVRREQIALAALELLAERGPADLGMAGIAKRLGLATSAIYRHFPGKDELVGAVLDLIASRLEANVAEACRASADPLACLESLLARHVALVLKNSGIPRLLFSGEVFCGAAGHRQRLLRLISGYLERVAAVIAVGQREGIVRDDVDAATLAVHFLGIVQPAVILGHLSDGRFDVERHASLGWELFVKAIAPGTGGGIASVGRSRRGGGRKGARP
jgi:AcrR family transcriptional regulator